jgi:hypothetical protein
VPDIAPHTWQCVRDANLPLPDVAPDLMLEAKAKDVAVAQLRRDLVRYAPDVAAVFDIAE